MKSHTFLNSRSAAASQEPPKAAQPRSSAAKQATHRYERRKVREYLRHGIDAEDASSRFEQFG